jgi:hypothetical protein
LPAMQSPLFLTAVFSSFVSTAWEYSKAILAVY